LCALDELDELDLEEPELELWPCDEEPDDSEWLDDEAEGVDVLPWDAVQADDPCALRTDVPPPRALAGEPQPPLLREYPVADDP
jgi:hypothetical protein